MYTLWYTNIAIENGPLIVDLPIKHGDFPVRYVNVYQRVLSMFVDGLSCSLGRSSR